MSEFKTMPPESFEIQKTNIIIRQFEPFDADDLLKLASDEPVKKFVPWAKFVTDQHTALLQIEEFQKSWQDHVRARYVIEQDGQFVGYIGLWPDDKAGFYEFGFAMLPEFRGVGLGTLVVQSLANHARFDLGAICMVAYVNDSNVASIATVLKLGFTPLEEFNKGDRRYEQVLTSSAEA